MGWFVAQKHLGGQNKYAHESVHRSLLKARAELGTWGESNGISVIVWREDSLIRRHERNPFPSFVPLTNIFVSIAPVATDSTQVWCATTLPRYSYALLGNGTIRELSGSEIDLFKNGGTFTNLSGFYSEQ